MPVSKTTKPTALKKGRAKTRLLKAKFLSLYADLRGNISAICSEVRINRATFYDWKEKDGAFRAAVDAAMEALIDHVEGKLHEAIDHRDIASIIFFLKCKAKKRGYVEKTEIEHSGEIKGVPVFMMPRPK
jgi:AcrR family transcriptional regulator